MKSECCEEVEQRCHADMEVGWLGGLCECEEFVFDAFGMLSQWRQHKIGVI